MHASRPALRLAALTCAIGLAITACGKLGHPPLSVKVIRPIGAGGLTAPRSPLPTPAPGQTFTIAPPYVRLTPGSAFQLILQASDGIYRTPPVARWVSSDTATVTVSATGELNGVAIGLARITATWDGGEAQGWAEVVTPEAPNPSAAPQASPAASPPAAAPPPNSGGTGGGGPAPAGGGGGPGPVGSTVGVTDGNPALPVGV